MPLFSLRQAQPGLELIVSHPCIKEYLAARAIGRRTCVAHLEMPPAWMWGARWAGTLRFGEQIGLDFSHGLLKAAGLPEQHCCLHVEGDLLKLSATDRRDGVRAAALMITACATARLLKHAIDDAEVNDVIAVAIQRSHCSLTLLDLRGNSIQSCGGMALGEALLQNRTLTELKIDSDFGLPIEHLKGIPRSSRASDAAALESLDLSVKGLGVASVAVIGTLLAKANTSLRNLSLLGNWGIGSEGGTLIAEALRVNESLVTLDVYGCRLRDQGVQPLIRLLKTRRSALRFVEASENELTAATEQELQDTIKRREEGFGPCSDPSKVPRVDHASRKRTTTNLRTKGIIRKRPTLKVEPERRCNRPF